MKKYVTNREYIVKRVADPEGIGGISYERTGEVVRCGCCKHEIDGYCGRPDGDGGYLLFGVEPDGFCKWGERK